MEAPTLEELYAIAKSIRRTAMPAVREAAGKTIAWIEYVHGRPGFAGLEYSVTLEVGVGDNLLTELFVRLSTAHLSDTTLEMLANSRLLDKKLSIQNYDGVGWWIIVMDGEGIGEDSQVPADLSALLAWALELNCGRILFDAMGQVVPQLKTYREAEGRPYLVNEVARD